VNASVYLNELFIGGSLFSENIIQKIPRKQMEWLFIISDLSMLDDRQGILDYMKTDKRVYEPISQSIKDEIEHRQSSRR